MYIPYVKYQQDQDVDDFQHPGKLSHALSQAIELSFLKNNLCWFR